MSCKNGKLDIPVIPVAWIQDQIKENPGMYAAAWSRLLELWNKYYLYGDNNGEKIQDDYIRMHKSMAAQQQFWKESEEWKFEEKQKKQQD